MQTIGLDIGTTTLSAIVLDNEDGRVLKVLTRPNKTGIVAPQAWMCMQHPLQIARQAEEMVAALKAEFSSVTAIGIDGQMHSILYLNAAGVPVSPLFTWQDGRGDQPYGGETYASHLSRLTDIPMNTGFGLTTHFWHIVNGKVPPDACVLCTIFDYVAMRLTGRSVPLMHVSGAASLGLWRCGDAYWNMQTLRLAGIDASFLPAVTDNCVLVGEDSDGIPVACAIGDNQASFIGSIQEMANTALINMGTGGQVSMVADVNGPLGDLERRPLGNGASILVGSTLCGGRAFSLLEDFVKSCLTLTGYPAEGVYTALSEAAERAIQRNDLPQVDTRFCGTRRQPELRGSITYIGVHNFQLEAFLGGTLVGMTGEIQALYQQMLTAGAAPAKRFVGAGNAIRKGTGLRRCFEKAFGRPLQIPVHREEAAYGAALFAMTAAGHAKSLEDAQRLIRYETP